MVEVVVIVPLVMVLLLGVVQFVEWARAEQVAQLAASEGDVAVRVAGGSVAAGEAQARQVIVTAGDSVDDASISGWRVGDGSTGISVTGRGPTVLPGLALAVSARSVGQVERFRASG